MVDLVKDWMTTGPVTVRRGANLADARQRMERQDIGRLLVVDAADQLVGLVTWGDVMEAWPSRYSMLDPAEVREMTSRILVDEIMATDLVTADPDSTIAEAVSLMFEHRVGALPIVEDNRVLGILSTSDILQGLVRILARPSSSG